MKLLPFSNIYQLTQTLSTKDACIQFMEQVRWNGKVISPFDPQSKVYKCSNGQYKCKSTNRYFNVRTGSIFQETRVPLTKWMIALYIFSTDKKGISSPQLGKMIGVGQKAAWFMLHMRFKHYFINTDIDTVTSEWINDRGDSIIFRSIIPDEGRQMATVFSKNGHEPMWFSLSEIDQNLFLTQETHGIEYQIELHQEVIYLTRPGAQITLRRISHKD